MSNHMFSTNWIGIGALSLLLSGAAIFPALATDFNPPKDGAPGRLVGAGSRSFDPPDFGNPERKEGAATRGPCNIDSENNKPFTALVPLSDGFGVTISKTPTFFAHIPKGSSEEVQVEVEFSLSDTEGKALYRTKVPMSEAPGVIAVQLPDPFPIEPLELYDEALKNTNFPLATQEKPPEMEPGKAYQWYFQMICNGQRDWWVDGWVQREQATADFADDLESASDEKKVELYAETGIWFDSVTTLARLRAANPDDRELAQKWQSLLAAGGVGAEIAVAPVYYSGLEEVAQE